MPLFTWIQALESSKECMPLPICPGLMNCYAIIRFKFYGKPFIEYVKSHHGKWQGRVLSSGESSVWKRNNRETTGTDKNKEENHKVIAAPYVDSDGVVFQLAMRKFYQCMNIIFLGHEKCNVRYEGILGSSWP